jgi:hypothetical protein
MSTLPSAVVDPSSKHILNAPPSYTPLPSSSSISLNPSASSLPRPALTASAAKKGVSTEEMKRVSLAKALTDKIAQRSNQLAHKLSMEADIHIQAHRSFTERQQALKGILMKLEQNEVKKVLNHEYIDVSFEEHF